MKVRNFTIIAAALFLSAHAIGCGDDGGTDTNNNGNLEADADIGSDAGTDAATDDTGGERDDVGPPDDTGQPDDTGEPDDTGQPDDTGEADAGDSGDTGAGDASEADGGDTGDTSPPPDDLDPLDGYWSEHFSVPGVVSPDGGVVNVVHRDETSGTVYLGGTFTDAGITSTSNIASWNGSNWEALGDGVDITVGALTTDDSGTLYAGGAGGGGGMIGPPSPNLMLSWDGTQWMPFAQVGPNNSTVRDMITLSSGDILVAGDFDEVDGESIANIARFDGTDWTSIDADDEPDGAIHDVVETADGFCIAGEFENIGSISANRAACWDGTDWKALGDGFNSAVHALLPLGNGEFLAGGQFSFPSTPTSTTSFVVGLAKYDGTSWDHYAGGVVGGSVTDVDVLFEGDDGEIYVGGTFDRVGPNRVYSQNFARLDGTTWSAVGTGLHEGSRIAVGPVKGANDMVSLDDGEYLVGGFFTNASETFAPNLAMWDGNEWSTFVNQDSPYLGADGNIGDFASGPNGNLYIGGFFDHIGRDGSPGVAEFDGMRWQPLGEGLDDANGGGVKAVAVAQDGTVYAGGDFQYAGSNVVSWVAQWDGSEWQSIGFGLNGTVEDLAVAPNGSLYAAGEFTLADGQDVGGIAEWDGTSWHPMDGGFADVGSGAETVEAVAVAEDGTVYAGGSFIETSIYSPVGHLAEWDGAQWTEVGGGVADHQGNPPDEDNAQVYDLDFWDSKLVVAGNFAKAGSVDAYSIALWDGTDWEALSGGLAPSYSGGRPGTAFSVAPKENGLFVTSTGREIDGVEVGFVGWWDGSAWHGLEDGVADVAEAVHVHDHSVFVGGPFTGASDGTSFHVARWRYDAAVAP